MRQWLLVVDKNQPVIAFKTMDETLAESMAPQQFNTVLLAIFAGVAMVLALAGLYGVMAYSVSQRIHEIGVRMALGAQRRHVLRLVVGQGMLLTVIGIAVGLAGAFGATRWLSTLLYEVSPTDWQTFTAIPVALAVVALAACIIPAYRASRVDPTIALRTE